MKHFTETLYDAYGQQFSIDKVYYQQDTDHQQLIIFQNALYGRVMALDGIVQTTEKDEFIYHEILAHVPVLAHGSAKNILVIGGGDGGILRELCKHQSIQKITQIEIDDAVIDMCKTYLPSHSAGAYDDPRLDIIIDDGFNYVKNCDLQYDIIISDSTDPIGPGKSLFTHEFYQHCARLLGDNGILVTQNGVAFDQLDEAVTSGKAFKALFNDWHFYSAAVPTYVGGIMLFGFATNNQKLRHREFSTIETQYQQAQLKTQYYNPAIHLASFALPQYVLEAIGKA